jgi:hypothetical protein
MMAVRLARFCLSRPTKYHAGQNRGCRNRISIRYYAAPLPPLGSSHPNAPLGSVQSTWEVESEIYGDDFSVCIGAGKRLVPSAG